MHITGLSYQLGSQAVDLSALSMKNEFTVIESMIFERMMGLKVVRREFLSTLLEFLSMAIVHLLNEYPINPHKIKYILFSHTSDEISPEKLDILSILIEQFDFKNAVYFGATAHNCLSVFKHFDLSKILVESLKDDEYILLLIGDIIFADILRYIPGSTVMGDAAACVLIQKNGKNHKFISSAIDCYGEFSRGVFGSDEELYQFQESYHHYLMRIIVRVIENAELKLSNIRIIFPHNVNVLSWKKIVNALKLDNRKIYLDNIPSLGHCFGADPFINLKNGIKEYRISPGDYYLLVSVGLGAIFGAMLFQY